MIRGKEAFCGPADRSALALFSQTSLPAHTDIQCLSVFRAWERAECRLLKNTRRSASISCKRDTET